MPKKKSDIPRSREVVSTDTQRGRADRLFRAAAECVRQRERYARLVDAGAHDAEQLSALSVACLCDKMLADCVKSYEGAAAAQVGNREDEWFHKANSLWHASREYARRHHDCDKRTEKLAGHTAQKLGELALHYDLEASALLALRMAMTTYRQACPDAELEDRPQTYVA